MLTILEANEVKAVVENLKNGAMTRLCYRSDVPVKAEYKKQGVRIIKVTETTVRFGVEYSHIHEVVSILKERTDEQKDAPKRANNWQWIIKNKIKHNTNTNEDYVYFATAKIPNTKSKYIVVDANGEVNSYTGEKAHNVVSEYAINSYGKGAAQPVRTVKVGNIIRINNTGMRLFDNV